MGRPIIKAYKKCELRDELGKYTIYLIVTLCSSKKNFFLEQDSKNVTTNPLSLKRWTLSVLHLAKVIGNEKSKFE